MGFFSWKTSDTKKNIWNSYSKKGATPSPVYMITEDGRSWKEDAYEGYGEFGGKDIYELIAELNGKYVRDAGIEINFKKNPSGDFEITARNGYKMPKLVEKLPSEKDWKKTWDKLSYPGESPNQGFFEQGGSVDKDIKAKPKGYRFKGDNTKRPLVRERGKDNVYYEARKNRSDKNLTKKLAKGGSVKELQEKISDLEYEKEVCEEEKEDILNGVKRNYKEGGKPGQAEWLIVLETKEGKEVDEVVFAKTEDEALHIAEQRHEGSKGMATNMLTDAEGNKIQYAKGGKIDYEKLAKINKFDMSIDDIKELVEEGAFDMNPTILTYTDDLIEWDEEGHTLHIYNNLTDLLTQKNETEVWELDEDLSDEKKEMWGRNKKGVARYWGDSDMKLKAEAKKKGKKEQGGNVDKDIKAKPRGWRFEGNNTKRPNESEKGKPGTYFEDRKNRSDKDLRKRLEEGGLLEEIDSEIGKHKADENYDNDSAQINKIFERFNKEVFDIDGDSDASEYLLKATPLEQLEYLKNRIANRVVDVSKATPGIIEQAINEDYFNEAISLLQNAIGGNGYPGDVASAHFSGFERNDDDNSILEWKDKSKRRKLIEDYLATEKLLADSDQQSMAKGGKTKEPKLGYFIQMESDRPNEARYYQIGIKMPGGFTGLVRDYMGGGSYDTLWAFEGDTLDEEDEEGEFIDRDENEKILINKIYHKYGQAYAKKIVKAIKEKEDQLFDSTSYGSAIYKGKIAPEDGLVISGEEFPRINVGSTIFRKQQLGKGGVIKGEGFFDLLNKKIDITW